MNILVSYKNIDIWWIVDKNIFLKKQKKPLFGAVMYLQYLLILMK